MIAEYTDATIWVQGDSWSHCNSPGERKYGSELENKAHMEAKRTF